MRDRVWVIRGVNRCFAGESNHRADWATNSTQSLISYHCSMSSTMEYSRDSLSKANRLPRNVCAYFSFCLQWTWPKSRSIISLAWERMCHTANRLHDGRQRRRRIYVIVGCWVPGARRKTRSESETEWWVNHMRRMPRQTNKPKLFFFFFHFVNFLSYRVIERGARASPQFSLAFYCYLFFGRLRSLRLQCAWMLSFTCARAVDKILMFLSLNANRTYGGVCCHSIQSFYKIA